jgi:hypothetical protein
MALAESSPTPTLLYRATQCSVVSPALSIKGIAIAIVQAKQSVSTYDSLNLPCMAVLLSVFGKDPALRIIRTAKSMKRLRPNFYYPIWHLARTVGALCLRVFRRIIDAMRARDRRGLSHARSCAYTGSKLLVQKRRSIHSRRNRAIAFNSFRIQNVRFNIKPFSQNETCKVKDYFFKQNKALKRYFQMELDDMRTISQGGEKAGKEMSQF